MTEKKQLKPKPGNLRRFITLRVLHTNDSPHRIALGTALGFFIAWTPALGLHILMAIALSFLLRANKFVAIICVWVSNPFTIIPIYYPNYLVGSFVLRWFKSEQELTTAEVRQLFSQFGLSAGLHGFFQIEFWQNLFNFLWQKGIELWIGSAIIGLVVALMAYVVTYYTIVKHRRNNPHRRFLPSQ